jgi:hypothetical protein
MYFEVLIKCIHGAASAYYQHYYIVKAEDQKDAIIKASDFISTYYVNEDKGTLLVDHDDIAYRFSDGEIVELAEISETTPEEFLENRIGKLFLIGG